MLCALALACLAPAAWAQDALTPEAADNAIAREIIASADATDVFEPMADGAVALRHIGSGMVCRFAAHGGRVVLFPGLPRGDNVGCDASDGRVLVTLYATRFPFNAPIDEQIRIAEQAVRQVSPDATPYEDAREIATDTLPAHRTVEFIIVREGQRLYTRASIAQIGAWTYKLRYTAPAPDDAAARQAALAGDLVWAEMMRGLAPQP